MNSTSDIVDELNLIKNTSNSPKTKKGPKTIDDIIESNIKDIENVLDSRVVNIYARPWNKLEPKLKLKKINEFFNLNTTDIDKNFVLKYYSDKKKVKVTYNQENCIIDNIELN
jgi:hypothetical protein